MTPYKKYAAAALMTAALIAPTAAQARGTSNQTKATIVGAVAGAALTGAMGGDGQSMLLGAAAGGLAGNAYAYHNKKMNQKESREHHRYREYRRNEWRDDWRKPHRHKRHKHRRDWDWDD